MTDLPNEQLSASRALAIRAALSAADKQALDVTILEVRDQIAITDHFVIASGSTDRHVKAIADGIEESLREVDEKPIRREGEQDLHWVLLDFGDIVVHVFLAEDRVFYDIERLWQDAPKIAWEGSEARSAP